MKKNNKGFIAISLIYSFFLVFLITLLAIVNDYAHNRVLLNDVKKETQEYLNGLAAFNPVNLENREYLENEEVTFGSEKWVVLENNVENVTLLLNRNFTTEEIDTALSNVGITNASSNERTLMCLAIYNPAVCNYKDTVTFNYYSWNVSIVKKIVEYWLSSNATFQKAISIGTMQSMSYSDGLRNYNSFIRIPTSSEYAIINDGSIWYLTSGSNTSGISYIKFGSSLVSAHNNYKRIKPVIMVKKTT